MSETERRTTYTHGHESTVLVSHVWRSVANSAAYLEPHLAAGTSVLDVGCGPGTITIDLAQRVAPGRVVGLDASSEVLDLASAAAIGAGVTNVEWVAGDLYELPVGNDEFDIVHAHQVLQHLVDPAAALREFARVCRPGGIIAVRDADYRAMTWFPEHPALDAWLELYEAVARANRAEPDAGRRLSSWALDAGLADVQASASVWCFATPDDRAWWGGMWAERVTDSAIGRQAVALGLATVADLAAMASAWHLWKDTPGAWFAVLHGEILARPG